MKVYANAFQIECTGELTLDDILSELTLKDYHKFQHGKRDRVLALEKRGGLFQGVVLSTKEQDTYLTVEEDEDGVPYAKHNHIEGGQSADFNYFVISSNTGNGIFTQYRGSGGLTQFGNLMKNRISKVIKTDLRDKELEEAREEWMLENDENFPKEVTQKIKKKYKESKFDLSPMSLNRDFEAEIKKLAKVTKFEFVSPDIVTGMFTSVKKEITFEKRSIHFSAKTGRLSQIVKNIGDYYSKNNLTDGKVFGKTPDGADESISINPELFCMEKYSYNDVAQGEIRLERFYEHKLVKKIIFLTTINSELF